MKRLSSRLALGFFLLILLAAPMVVYADKTVYVDETGTVARDTSQPAGSARNPANDVAAGLTLMAGQSGMIIDIYNGGLGTQFCELPINNGTWNYVKRNCKLGVPPETGEPVATTFWWMLAGAAAVVLLGAGMFLRRRGLSAPRTV